MVPSDGHDADFEQLVVLEDRVVVLELHRVRDEACGDGAQRTRHDLSVDQICLRVFLSGVALGSQQ